MKKAKINKISLAEVFNFAHANDFERFKKVLPVESESLCDAKNITKLEDQIVVSNATLCKEWAKQNLYDVHKSKKDETSSALNNLAFMLIPVCTVIFLRVLRRKR